MSRRYDRIFVIGTGRCGTTTFSKACSHITNYTCAHESHRGRVADLDYPEGHIEVDGHLAWVLPLLLDKYPADDGKTLYVHLQREAGPCIESIAKRKSLTHYSGLVWKAKTEAHRKALARVQYENTNLLIEMLLRDMVYIENIGDSGDYDANHYYRIWMHEAQDNWRNFWSLIGANGDFNASCAEWDVKYNASEPEPAHA